MKKLSKLSLTLMMASVFTLSLSSCSNGVTQYGKPAKAKEITFALRSGDSSYLKIEDSVGKFGSRLLSSVYSSLEEINNIALSPASLYMSLALAACCSNGSTREEIMKALEIDYDNLRDGFYILYNLLNYDSDQKKRDELVVSNSIWLQNNFSVIQECIDSLSNDFYCYSYGTDFFSNNAKGNKEISKFIKKQTDGMIDKDFGYRMETVFVILNVLYYEDVWNVDKKELDYYADEKGNSEFDFTHYDGKTTKTTLFHNKYQVGKAYENDIYRTFYTQTDNSVKIQFIVPQEGVSLDEIATSEVLNEAHNATYYIYDDHNMFRYNTRAIFPEFNGSYDGKMKEILIDEFGINELFDKDKANLSSITDETGVYCQEVDHVTQLSFTKKGVRGSSASSFSFGRAMSATGGDEYTDVYEDFFVDQSFAYIISDYDIPIFMGVVDQI